MTAATYDAGATPSPRQGWRALLTIAVLTAIWLVINYWFPALNASAVPSITTRLIVHVLIGLGLWLALERTELNPRQRITTWLAVILPFTLWLAVIWNMAVFDSFRPVPGGARVPLLPLAIVVPVIVGAPILLLSRRIGQVIDAMPASWLVALQVYRVFGGIFLVGWLRGVLFWVFAVPAGIGDILTGLFALPVAYLLASGTEAGRKSAIAWNIFGLCDFAVAITMGFISAPGPLQLIVPSVQSIGTSSYPTVMVPAFAVPSSILLHLLSLRQLRRRSDA